MRSSVIVICNAYFGAQKRRKYAKNVGVSGSGGHLNLLSFLNTLTSAQVLRCVQCEQKSQFLSLYQSDEYNLLSHLQVFSISDS